MDANQGVLLSSALVGASASWPELLGSAHWDGRGSHLRPSEPRAPPWPTSRSSTAVRRHGQRAGLGLLRRSLSHLQLLHDLRRQARPPRRASFLEPRRGAVLLSRPPSFISPQVVQRTDGEPRRTTARRCIEDRRGATASRDGAGPRVGDGVGQREGIGGLV